LDPYFSGDGRGAAAVAVSLPARSIRFTIPVSGTGSAGMETCFVNLIEPGDEVVVWS